MNFEASELWSSDSASLTSYVRQQVDDALSYRDIPFHQAVAELRRLATNAMSDDLHPVFQVYFNFRQTLDFPRVALDGITEPTKVTQLTTNNAFEFSCTVDEIDKDMYQLQFEYDNGIFAEESVVSFGRDYLMHLTELCESQSTTPGLKHGIPVNPRAVGFPRSCGTLQTAFLEQCRLTPERPALRKPDGITLTYAELYRTVMRRALLIRRQFFEVIRRQLRPDDVIPVVMEFNEAVLWILGVLMAGAAYSPIDPSYPAARVRAMIDQLGARAAIYVSNGPSSGLCGIAQLNCVREETDDTPQDIAYLESIQPTDLAYVIFTSGSTGVPKGVCVEHRSVTAFLECAVKDLDVSEQCRIAHSVNTVFDVNVFNMFAPLVSGGCLVQCATIWDVLNERPLRDGQTPFTHLFLTSAMFNALDAAGVRRIAQLTAHVIVGGETPCTQSITAVLEQNIAVTQIYGPTEATVWVARHRYAKDEVVDGTIIGKRVYHGISVAKQ